MGETEGIADKYIAHVSNAIDRAEEYKSNISKEVLSMEGMTGQKTRHFYNNLAVMPDARYLEIGTWKGSSVCAVLDNNKVDVVCIDNWCEHNGPREECMANIAKYRNGNDVKFIETDSFKVDVSTISPRNIYMYDGDHSAECQKLALTYYISCLDDVFIFVVDDYSWPKVQEGTRAGISELGLIILYEAIFLTKVEDKFGWWNGVYIAVLQKPGAKK